MGFFAAIHRCDESQDQRLLLGLRGLCLHHVVLDDGFVSAPPAAAAHHRCNGEGRGWTSNILMDRTSSWRLYTNVMGTILKDLAESSFCRFGDGCFDGFRQ